jgi:hypothetical protein
LRRNAAPALMLSVAALSACDLSPTPDAAVQTPRPYRSGDPNVPVRNAHPNDPVQFTATVPPSLKKDFTALYGISWVEVLNKDGSLNRVESPPGCPISPRDGFSVTIPIALEKDGNAYRGTVALDAFTPGPCLWRFEEISSALMRTAVVTRQWSRSKAGSRDIRVDVWCTLHHKLVSDSAHPSALNQLYNCVPLDVAPFFVDLPPGFYKSIPEYQRPLNTLVPELGPNTRSIDVEFHDLDELIPAYSRTHPVD